MREIRIVPFAIAISSLLYTASTADAAPVLYNSPFNQSPVRADPGDLLTISGSGFSSEVCVVYERYAAQTPPAAPVQVPQTNGASSGTIPPEGIVRTDSTITFKLPKMIVAKQHYAFFAKNGPVCAVGDDWSAPATINDPRLSWFSPATTFETTATYGGLERAFRVVGRNLWSRPTEMPVQKVIRFSGPATYEIPAETGAATMEEFVIDADLPTSMAPGDYAVSVSFDGGLTWQGLADQNFTVFRNPPAKPVFSISDYGGLYPENGPPHACWPNDGKDDTWCVVRATIDASRSPSGGVVYFDDGVWDLKSPPVLDRENWAPWGAYPWHGIIVPNGVDLVGADRETTKVLLHPEWHNPTVFTLLGSTHPEERGLQTVTGITFQEKLDTHGQPRANEKFFFVGLSRTNGVSLERTDVDNIAIYDARFDAMDSAFWGTGQDMSNIYIHNNEFSPFRFGIYLNGRDATVNDLLEIEDIIISDNLYGAHPKADKEVYHGSDLKIRPYFSHLSSGARMVYARNTIDGRKPNARLRAGAFWDMTGVQRSILVSENIGWCTGEIHDGEFLSFDGPGQRSATKGHLGVRPSGPIGGYDVVVLDGSVRHQDLDRYRDHSVFIVDGVGAGQVRAIEKYETGANTILSVTTNWNVRPKAGSSRVMILRAYSDLTVEAKSTTNRSTKCRQKNSDNEGGYIVLAGTINDSIVQGNSQDASSGIQMISQYYTTDEVVVYPGTPQEQIWKTFFNANLYYSIAIKGNTIVDSYNHGVSGIRYHLHSAPLPSDRTAETFQYNPILAHDVNIGHNLILRTAHDQGNAIFLAPSGGHPTAEATRAFAIHNNTMPDAPCSIAIREPMVTASVISENQRNVSVPATLRDNGTDTVILDQHGVCP